MKAHLLQRAINLWGMFCVGTTLANAQIAQTTKDIFNYTGRVGNPVQLGNSFSTIYGTPPPPADVIGDNYLDTTFVNARFVLFKDSTVYGAIPARLDLRNDLIELRTPQGPRVLDGFRLRFFMLDYSNALSRLMVNTKNFEFEAQTPTGFLELLSSGSVALGVHHKVWMRQPTYNAALGSGDRDYKILKEKDYYYIKGSKAVKFSPSKKSLLAIFANKKAEMEQFFSNNNTNFKVPDDVAKAFSYYNSLQ